MIRVADTAHLLRVVVFAGLAVQMWARSDASFAGAFSMRPLVEIVAAREVWAALLSVAAALMLPAAFTRGRWGTFGVMTSLLASVFFGTLWTIGNAVAPQGPLMLALGVGTLVRLSGWRR